MTNIESRLADLSVDPVPIPLDNKAEVEKHENGEIEGEGEGSASRSRKYGRGENPKLRYKKPYWWPYRTFVKQRSVAVHTHWS